MPPSFPCSTGAESKIESTILTNILPFNSFVKNESMSELKYVNPYVFSTCVTVD